MDLNFMPVVYFLMWIILELLFFFFFFCFVLSAIMWRWVRTQTGLYRQSFKFYEHDNHSLKNYSPPRRLWDWFMLFLLPSQEGGEWCDAWNYNSWDMQPCCVYQTGGVHNLTVVLQGSFNRLGGCIRFGRNCWCACDIGDRLEHA